MYEPEKPIVSPKESATLAYKIGRSLYLNITNRCSNTCIFCPKFNQYKLYGHDLLLAAEPSFEEVMAAFAVMEPSGIDEIVFCGFGESLIRLELVVRIARELKRLYRYPVRINTDGQANLVHGRNILPDLAGLVDTISVSMNASDAETYMQLCDSPFGDEGFCGVCDFIRLAKQQIPNVIASVVDYPGVDLDACRALALSLGVSFRIR